MRALSLYQDAPPGVRLHTRLRAFTCPMDAVLAHVPDEGRLLEVGCGPGLFANEAALRSPRLEVLGIDPSSAKVRWADRTVRNRPNVRFRVRRVEQTSETGFDAVAILDVLYLVPRADWLTFLRACRERLRPGGRLLLKEVDVRPRWKFYRCLLQEIVSVQVLGMTLGRTLAFAPPWEVRELLEKAGFRGVTVTDLARGYCTPHVLYEAAA